MRSVPLGDVVAIKGGGTPSKSRPEYYTGNIPWVSPKDMKSWNISDAQDRVTSEAIANSATSLIPERSILVVNRSGILKHTVPVAINRVPVAINQDLKALICSDAAHPEYIARLVKAAEHVILGWVRATTADNFPIDNLRALKIPLPPFAQQKRIAAILDQADDLRRKRQRAIERVNQLAQAMFHEMFGDPVANPKGWAEARLVDLCGVGSSKRVFVNEFVEEGVPFYRGTEVGKLGAGEAIKPSLFITPEHYQNLIGQSGKPNVGDLLLPSICDDGRIWKVDSEEPFYFKDGRVLWIKVDSAKINSEYLRRFLQHFFLKEYASIASGTTFAELKIVNLKQLSILCPPLKMQNDFSTQIAQADKLRSSALRSEKALDAAFRALQHSAFLGEL